MIEQMIIYVKTTTKHGDKGEKITEEKVLHTKEHKFIINYLRKLSTQNF